MCDLGWLYTFSVSPCSLIESGLWSCLSVWSWVSWDDVREAFKALPGTVQNCWNCLHLTFKSQVWAIPHPQGGVLHKEAKALPFFNNWIARTFLDRLPFSESFSLGQRKKGTPWTEIHDPHTFSAHSFPWFWQPHFSPHRFMGTSVLKTEISVPWSTYAKFWNLVINRFGSTLTLKNLVVSVVRNFVFFWYPFLPFLPAPWIQSPFDFSTSYSYFVFFLGIICLLKKQQKNWKLHFSLPLNFIV